MFAQSYSSHYVIQEFYKLLADIRKPVAKYDRLDVCHHWSAGMKALFTQQTQEGLALIRQSLGGAGFTAWSGLPELIKSYSP